MATKTIAWTSGSGYITLTYTGIGNSSISVKSDANDLFEDRQQNVQIVTTNGSPQKAVSLLVKQKGKTYPVGTVFNYSYTGSVQQVTLPKGKYKLQCWGAQGGSVSGSYTATGSKGGYSEGVLTLTKTTTIYIFVGGQGTSSSTSSTSGTANGGWNGGGASIRKTSYDNSDIYGESYPRPGGGSTDMCLVTSSMSYSSGRTNRSSASLLSRFIVAGGGAGASARYTEETTETTNTSYENVGNGKLSYSWNNGTYWYYYKQYLNDSIANGKRYRLTINGGSYNRCFIQIKNKSTGQQVTNLGTTFNASYDIDTYYYELALESALGSSISYTYILEEVITTTDTEITTSSGKSNSSQQGGGTSGKGQYPGTQSSAGSGGDFGLGANQTTTGYRYVAGAGGGGWYGGGTGKSDSSTSYVNYSGGGSGFVNTSANASYRPSGYTGLQLDSGSTTAGNSSHPSTSGGTETGHSGNGYARITVIE